MNPIMIKRISAIFCRFIINELISVFFRDADQFIPMQRADKLCFIVNFLTGFFLQIPLSVNDIFLLFCFVNRVGGDSYISVLSHHRTYGTVYGGSNLC